jgi:hypothetical protein
MAVHAPNRSGSLSGNSALLVTALAQFVYGIIMIGFDLFLFGQAGGIPASGCPGLAVAGITGLHLVSLFPHVFAVFINMMTSPAFHTVIQNMGLVRKFDQAP